MELAATLLLLGSVNEGNELNVGEEARVPLPRFRRQG